MKSWLELELKNCWCVFWGQKVSRLSVHGKQMMSYLLNSLFSDYHESKFKKSGFVRCLT